MKAGPILFNMDMVKAILAGRKTQTRRMVKLPKDCYWLSEEDGTWIDSNLEHGYWHAEELPCPLGEAPLNGQPGDLLYVRETFCPDPLCDDDSWADNGCSYVEWVGCGLPANDIPEPLKKPENCIFRADWTGSPVIWTPSIHMPRWASRLTLEITDVRVERLQEISNDDALAEGIGAPLDQRYAAIDAFRPLWNSIYGNWDTNPWVWVVEFKAHHCNVDAMLNERLAA